MVANRVEYVRLPLAAGWKVALQRRADEERRTLGQMAACIVMDELKLMGFAAEDLDGPWRTPSLIPPDG
ncbi:MAG: hypothetical protein A2138_26890 [Deltaproteobacteria bacterium RBG_16_71_12]|nr:MAG: hypothetical protein A2138_26890 [Deltaproteobacteria bacterium RBG_16_71_12]